MSKPIRAGKKFLSWRDKKREELKLSDSQLTDAIASFMEEENLSPWFNQSVKKNKKKKRGLWF